MRFVWAVAAFVLATVMIGAGIAQRTIFQGPRTETTAISVEEETPYLLIDGAVLNQKPGTQTLRAQAEGDIFASYGRTADMEAWLSDTTYTHVTLAGDGDVETAVVEPEIDAIADPATDAPADGSATDDAAADASTDAATDAAGRSPVGSDLWLDEYQQKDLLIAPLQLPEEMSVLVAADGTAPAPSKVTVTWPLQTSTPWAGPLIVGGGILMAAGVFLYILGIRHARRKRGPRRKGLPLPVTEPIDIAIDGDDKGVISSSRRTPRAVASGRRAFAVLPVIAVSALLFTGCSADAWPQLGASPTPTPTATVIAPDGQQAPAVTKAQAERILTRIAATVADADAAMDGDLAETRLEGAALAARDTNYKLRSALGDYPTPAPILSKPLEIILPQAYDAWPRSVIAIADDEESKTSSIMVLTQQDQWSEYKLSYVGSLEASTAIPDLAPAYIGAAAVEPDSPFLVLPPDQVAAAYADVISKDKESEYYDLFEADGDQLRASIAADRQRRRDEFNQTANSGASTGTLEFGAVAGPQAPFALQTVESGAIVAVNINEVDTAKPTNADAVIKVENNRTVKTLAGADQSATGFETTFSDQVFFYVPNAGSNEKIRLLGYSSDILDAKIL
ncbi:glycosyl transferase [Microbacterium sp. QXD-8]|uniref:Glycosyl transferase n=1 Tax=Microbacterium psychrotolerans TaxID=3068321 RepID=A0ABU0YZ31_9MICO|nr:glycosyl transferase [Microbacterium sp. QXD-8]MDQ7877594.1 glycosyl transferase [Microbacterium sp. QXD-8]